jgi:hypothetical protein
LKFIRREDLDVSIRINIAMLALACQGVYGARTALAQEYSISRTFLYQLLNTALFCLTELFSAESLERLPVNLLDADRAIVLLRLEGKVSIASIGEIMSQYGHPHHSTGLISGRLTEFGRYLPHTLSSNRLCEVFFLSDEIFALGCPILITIEPKSTAILKIELASNRQSETWRKHFLDIEAQHFKSTGLCSDRGVGLTQGFHAACPDQKWVSDHFHEFYDLQALLVTLETKAYAAIEFEHERQRVFNNARSEANIENRRQQLAQATEDCMLKIDRYQHVADVLALLFPALYFFDLRTGALRRENQVRETILTLMAWLDELDYLALQDETQAIRSHIDSICSGYQRSAEIYQALSTTIPAKALNFAGLAWQYDHQSHQYKGERQKHYQAESHFWLEVAESLLAENSQTVLTQVFEAFDDMNRTSSLIEMVNSLIRPYLNACKGQITQEHLNLIMFYHNHHHYKSGKRKGNAPIEILNGTALQKHWLELLFDTVEQNKLKVLSA